MSEELSERKQRKARPTPPAVYLVAGILAAIAGFGTVYVSFAPSDNGRLPKTVSATSGGEDGVSATAGEGAASSPLSGLNQGAMAAFVVRPEPVPLPDFVFTGANGTTKSLTDFSGKVVLLNIWATWCVPCREEMPMLDTLQAELGGKDFEVVAVSIDKGGPDKARDFLEETGVTHLALFTDPPGKLFSTLKAVGMPTTLLIDREGREIGRLVGPADWASAEAKRLIEAAIAAPQPSAS
ncbi:MAG: TlpA family protein disulfide reductase [Methyloceanibacter sp.]